MRGAAAIDIHALEEGWLTPLRDAYRRGGGRAGLQAGARQALVAPFSPSEEPVSAILDRYYAAAVNPLCPPRERERIVIALLAAKGASPSNLATHFYWALMEDMTLKEIAETLLLASMYAGIDAYATGIHVLQDTVLRLQALATQADLSPGNVIRRLRAPDVARSDSRRSGSPARPGRPPRPRARARSDSGDSPRKR